MTTIDDFQLDCLEASNRRARFLTRFAAYAHLRTLGTAPSLVWASPHVQPKYPRRPDQGMGLYRSLPLDRKFRPRHVITEYDMIVIDEPYKRTFYGDANYYTEDETITPGLWLIRSKRGLTTYAFILKFNNGGVWASREFKSDRIINDDEVSSDMSDGWWARKENTHLLLSHVFEVAMADADDVIEKLAEEQRRHDEANQDGWDAGNAFREMREEFEAVRASAGSLGEDDLEEFRTLRDRYHTAIREGRWNHHGTKYWDSFLDGFESGSYG